MFGRPRVVETIGYDKIVEILDSDDFKAKIHDALHTRGETGKDWDVTFNVTKAGRSQLHYTDIMAFGPDRIKRHDFGHIRESFQPKASTYKFPSFAKGYGYCSFSHAWFFL